eukprot:3486322-Pyramimonas_sp.AAC.1
MHQTGDFWLAPATSKPFAAGLGAGKEYGKAVRAAGKKHGLGSSHVHVAMATLWRSPASRSSGSSWRPPITRRATS